MLIPICTWTPTPQTKEADEALVRLAEERNTIVGEKDAAVRQVVELQNQVCGLWRGRQPGWWAELQLTIWMRVIESR